MRRVAFWIGFVVLLAVHHDFWFWSDSRIVLGFLPIGLAYQALISLLAAGLWTWAVLGVWREVFSEDKKETVPS